MFAGWFVKMACIGLLSSCYYPAAGEGLRTRQDCEQLAHELLRQRKMPVTSVDYECVQLYEGKSPDEK